MATETEIREREIVVVEDARIRPMMGIDVLEPLPSRKMPDIAVVPRRYEETAPLGTSTPPHPTCRSSRSTWPRSDISPSNA